VSHRTYDHAIPVQFRDLDPRAHVNHATYVAYPEQTEGRFFADVLGVSLADAPTVVRSLDVDYRDSIAPDETVRVALGPVEVGETSLAIDYELSAGGRLAATARTVSVLLDDDGDPMRVPEDWRDALVPYAPEPSNRVDGTSTPSDRLSPSGSAWTIWVTHVVTRRAAIRAAPVRAGPGRERPAIGRRPRHALPQSTGRRERARRRGRGRCGSGARPSAAVRRPRVAPRGVPSTRASHPSSGSRERFAGPSASSRCETQCT
jgi:acyl-CoA thioester hydrolase